jgi:hypothetical protein
MSFPTPDRPRRSRLLSMAAALALVGVGVVAYVVWTLPRPRKADPTAAVVANLRGAALVGQGGTTPAKYEEAEKAFEEAISLDPDWTPAKINLGIALLNQQSDQSKTVSPKAERAKGIFREILAKEPDNPHAHYCLGIMAQYFGDLPTAYEHFAAVNKVDPRDAQTWLRLGTCHPDGPQSPAARTCLEQALRLDPYLNEARYRLFQTIQADDPKAAKAVLAEFEKLREGDWENPSRLDKYTEQGKYAEAIGLDPTRTRNPSVGPIPVFDSPAAFQALLAPGARWATRADLDPLRQAARDRFGGAMVLFDYNRDGRPDVFLASAVVQDGKVRDLLLRNDGGLKFTDVTREAGLAAPRPSLGAAVADYDNNGFPDLVVTGAGEQHLFRNKGDGTFEDVSAAAGLDTEAGVCVGCGWADLDQDCDLDLVLCRYADTAAAAAGFAADKAVGGVVLFENVGEALPGPGGDVPPPLTTKLRTNDVLAKACGPCAAVGVVIADLDGDGDPDLLVLADRVDPILVENDRILRFRRATPTWTDRQAHRWNGGLAFLATRSVRPDLLLVRADGPPLFLTAMTGEGYAVGAAGGPALRQAAAADLDLDGWPDVIALSAAGKPALLHNQGQARLQFKADALGLPDALPPAWAVACASLDGGATDVVLWTEERGLAVRRAADNGNHALLVEPSGRKNPGWFMRTNADGIGCRVTAQLRDYSTAAERTTAAAGPGQSLLPLRLGLGRSEHAEALRLQWPDAIVQAVLATPAGGLVRISEVSNKSTSCPILLTWDGKRFAFVTDFLGAGSMGELGPDGSTRPPRPEESVKIEPGFLNVKNGNYVLKIAEPMDEVCYLDHLRLDVVDHPAGAAVYPDERFATADPQPTQELLAFRDRRFPKKATDHRGADVTTLVSDRDRRAPDGFRVRSWLGFAEDHSLTLDFGDLPAAKGWHLVIAGWTEYPYPESIYAAERAGVPLQFPVLERLAADGKTWEPLGDLGFPAGLPRVMTRPVPDLKPGPCTLRVRTNMQVYCDQVYLAQAEEVALKVHILDAAKADLAARGFIQEVYPDGRPPLAYDDSKTETVAVAKWKGKLTRTGDVTELLTAGDDRFVVFGPGDEVTVQFDASKLPPVPAGWERSFVLRTRGYSKDTAPYTATGGNVLPLPFRAMKNYPDFGGARAPATDAATWNTRPVGGR